jgi:hypothetical protein
MKKTLFTCIFALLFILGMYSIANATQSTADDSFMARHSNRWGNQSGHDDHRSFDNVGNKADGKPSHQVPEPQTLLLLGAGVVSLALFRRKLKSHE